MTTPMRVQQRIRQLQGAGLNHTEIARRLRVSRTTVVKYAGKEDYSPKPPTARAKSRSLVDAGYADVVDGWLRADLRLARKQRHTARRVHDRLVAEHGFAGEYSSVQRWVKRWRESHRGEADGFAELAWAPGIAQVDFGQARAVVAGVERVVHFLVVSFPYSNMRYVTALPGETAECVCHGLTLVFMHMGMVPNVLVFDNATGVGHRNKDGSVTQTRLFSLFCAHYGFETRFCNPYSGHEKGSVENAVGFVRRNLMVPVPAAEGFDALSRAWLRVCDSIGSRDHYRRDVPIADLFAAELERMRPLPRVVFDACDWRTAKADKTGTVVIDTNRYCAGPRWHGMRLNIGVRALSVELRDPDSRPVATFDRLWGHDPKTQVDPLSLLGIIARKPRVWGESPIRGDFPENARDLLDRMDARARRDLIEDIRKASASSGFAAATRAVSAIIDAGRQIDASSLDQMARRISQDGSTSGSQDLKRYDAYMEEQ